MNHGGKCENLHGHNYAVEFTIAGEQTDDVGRVIDFAVIKALFKGWIDENWDHGFILWDKDVDVIQAIHSLQSKVYIMPTNPTAENMASYLLDQVGPKLLGQIDQYDVRLIRVAVWETEESCAVAKVDVQKTQEKQRSIAASNSQPNPEGLGKIPPADAVRAN